MIENNENHVSITEKVTNMERGHLKLASGGLNWK